MDEGLDFRCNECGSRELLVLHDFVLQRLVERSLECQCGSADDGVAAYRIVLITEERRNTFELFDDHRTGSVPIEREIENAEGEEQEGEVSCAACLNEATSYDWQEVEEEEPESADDEFWVVCSGCGREIEFGWSHPNRGGRVWPAESKDFNPWKCWPEPRYYEAWLAKGWIRPDLR